MFTTVARAFLGKQTVLTIFSIHYLLPVAFYSEIKMFKKDWTHMYISGPDKPIYFRRQTLQTESESTKCEDSKLLRDFKGFYLFTTEQTTDKSFQTDYVLSSVKSHLAYRNNGSWPSTMFGHALFFRDVKTMGEQSPKRGVFCVSLSTENFYDVEAKVKTCSEETCLQVYSITRVQDCIYEAKLLNNDTSETVVLELVPQSSIGCLQDAGNESSPIFNSPKMSPVFHEFAEARIVLEMLSADTPEVKELLQIIDKHMTEEMRTAQKQALLHPFVVVEGMDATGKTTLTERLENEMNAVRYFTPPPQITHLRAFFDKYPEIVRRAYYSMGNYLVAQEIIQQCQSRPVIMDRFWHSTAAYGIANESSTGDIPNLSHTVYKWPKDLLKPTLVLFLTVSEDERKKRLSGRGLEATFEERSLDKDQLFRQRLCEAYRRMREPSCIEIDAGGTVEEVFNKALQVLADHGINLSNTEK